MAKDPEQLAHQEWLGYVQPIGLVVSVPALLAAQAYVNRNIVPDHQRFLSCLRRDKNDDVIPEIRDLAEFSQTALGWEANDLIRRPTDGSFPDELSSLEIVLPEYHETLRPTHVVCDSASKAEKRPLMLVCELPSNTDFDEPTTTNDRGWQAAPHAKFERLLRETTVPIGLLFNQTHLRLVYAPRGETSGYMTFSVSEMAQVAGRPIFAGLHLLLSAERLFSLPEKQRLPTVLAESRKYQNTVSTQLSEQVLGALYELLRGFQAANDHRHGDLLRDVLNDDPNQVYAGLLNVLMRLVFVLYAEDRGVLPGDPVYANHYSVTGLFERLREDAGHHPDTMDLRFGAWGQLLTLFRMIHGGGSHGGMKIPPREGYLFDPDRYPFLEGRSRDRTQVETFDVPRVSDGVVFRVLSSLLILDSERLSYRTLDVEQVGSVYEAIMGFDLDVAQGRSIAVKPAKPHGAPTTINLEELLVSNPKDRQKWVRDRTDQALTGEALEKLEAAETVNDLLEALNRKIAKTVTPSIIPKGAMVLQPSDERRRSGSHYTPRSLTEPIVRMTLRPILDSLGDRKRPEQILDLKICDPAMGSGAFLVEACRQLGDDLVKAWHIHDGLPAIPPDEDEVLHASRLVAQRCLYGVDKNPMAVDLAKLSLWLATLAKDHQFTFLDHSLRCGDSLVGVSREQIIRFHWKPSAQRALDEEQIRKRVKRATEYRRKILENAEGTSYLLLQQHLALSDETLRFVRLIGDAVVVALFTESNDRRREERRSILFAKLLAWVTSGLMPAFEEPLAEAVKSLRTAEKPIEPFHWEIEFPEVFARQNGGFDAIVGNPPYAGNRTLAEGAGEKYSAGIRVFFDGSAGRTDLVAFFIRRALFLSRDRGTIGFLTTNTVSQGDTRRAGLARVCSDGAHIYAARRRVDWIGSAAVVPSIIWLQNGQLTGLAVLDGREVTAISPFLVPGSVIEPSLLHANSERAFLGCKPGAEGFVVSADEVPSISCNVEEGSLSEYLGGSELCDEPDLMSPRLVFRLGVMDADSVQAFPKALKVLQSRLGVNPAGEWWRFARAAKALTLRSRQLHRVLVRAEVSNTFAYAFKSPASCIFSNKVIVTCFEDEASLSVLQSRLHEEWARLTSGTLGDQLSYVPDDSFGTFPFPREWRNNGRLTDVGRDYYDFRLRLMAKNNEGLTKTYNRFHDRNDSSAEVMRLRELHDAMDRAVLDAYGWTDLKPTCEFLLDYEKEDDESESDTRRRKKPWRFRWPDDFRDEVLARLLELNKQRAEEERLAGIVANADISKRGSAKRLSKAGQKKAADDHPSLMEYED